MRFLAQLFCPALFNAQSQLPPLPIVLLLPHARKPAYLQSQPERAPAATPFAIALCFIDGFMAAKLQAFTCNGRVYATLKVMPPSASFGPGTDDPPPCLLVQLSVPAVCRIT